MTRYRLALDAASTDNAANIQILRPGRIRQVNFNVVPGTTGAVAAGAAQHTGVEVSFTGVSNMTNTAAVQPTIATAIVSVYGSVGGTAIAAALTVPSAPVSVDIPVAVGQLIYVNCTQVFGNAAVPVDGFIEILVLD